MILHWVVKLLRVLASFLVGKNGSDIYNMKEISRQNIFLCAQFYFVCIGDKCT